MKKIKPRLKNNLVNNESNLVDAITSSDGKKSCFSKIICSANNLVCKVTGSLDSLACENSCLDNKTTSFVDEMIINNEKNNLVNDESNLVDEITSSVDAMSSSGDENLFPLNRFFKPLCKYDIYRILRIYWLNRKLLLNSDSLSHLK